MNKNEKIYFKPETILYPLPAVMISCGSKSEEYNIITVSWTGTVNSVPPKVYISVRPERHSYNIIKKNMEFVINLTTRKLADAADFNGVKSGKNINKFEASKLTPLKCKTINTVCIAESPVNIECKVTQIIPLGSHDMFIADVTAISVNHEFADISKNKTVVESADFIVYSQGNYFTLGEKLGKTGFSVSKKL